MTQARARRAVALGGVLWAFACVSGVPSQRTVPEIATHCSLETYNARFGPLVGNPDLVPENLLDSGFGRVSGPPAIYPVRERGAGIEGWVIVGLVVTPEGFVADGKAMASSHPVFEDAALAAATGSRFTGPRKDGMPVWAFRCQPITFKVVYGDE